MVYHVRQRLTVEYFHDIRHRLVYQTIFRMLDERRNVDLMLLTQRLADDGELDNAGGSAYLSDLIIASPTTVKLDDHIDILREKYQQRKAIEIGTEMAHCAGNGCDDVAEYLGQVSVRLADLVRAESNQDSPRIADSLPSVEANLLRRWEGDPLAKGHPTGFSNVDNVIGGLRDGQLAVLAAARSGGKSTLAGNIVAHYARHGEHVSIFSLEMTRDEYIERLIAAEARQNLALFDKRRQSQAVFDAVTRAANVVRGWPIDILDRRGRKAADLLAEARHFSLRNNTRLVVVDHLQLVEARDPQSTRNDAVGENSKRFKIMAGELHCPVLLLSQLNRESLRSGERPRLHHLRASGEIEEDADLVLLLSGDLSDNELRDLQVSQNFGTNFQRQLVLVDIAKNRGGPTATTLLRFVKEQNRFEDVPLSNGRS